MLHSSHSVRQPLHHQTRETGGERNKKKKGFLWRILPAFFKLWKKKIRVNHKQHKTQQTVHEQWFTALYAH